MDGTVCGVAWPVFRTWAWQASAADLSQLLNLGSLDLAAGIALCVAALNLCDIPAH